MMEGGVLNRIQLRQLAEDRILDAERLLTGGRYAGAYYLAGNAVECGLKACILAHVEAAGTIFVDKRFSEKCWTHDLEDLLALASLAPTLEADGVANAAFAGNWDVAIEWEETSRYEQKTQAEAQRIYDAITNQPNGVLPWIRIRW
jgi:HEPN domain-containing protein